MNAIQITKEFKKVTDLLDILEGNFCADAQSDFQDAFVRAVRTNVLKHSEDYERVFGVKVLNLRFSPGEKGSLQEVIEKFLLMFSSLPEEKIGELSLRFLVGLQPHKESLRKLVDLLDKM